MRSKQSRTLFLVWKANVTGEHVPVGRLQHADGKTTFQYVSGVNRAIEKGMGLIPEFPDTRETYETDTLFRFFQNRLMERSRPDFGDYIASLGLEHHDTMLLPFEVLERSEGKKVTDRFRIFRKPDDDHGNFQLHCFVSGMTREPNFTHLEELLSTLEESDRLFPSLEVQNRFDKYAIGLKKENGWTIGFVPAYYSPELQPLLRQDPESVQFRIVQINRPARSWLPDVVLISITGKFPRGWAPFEKGDYASLQDRRPARSKVKA